MSIRSRFAVAALSAAALIVSTPSAFAAIGYASSAVNLRAGAGIGYRVVDTLYKGEEVHVIRCEGSWCLVIHTGADGWASRKYLVNPDLNRGKGFEFPDHPTGPDRYNGVPGGR